MGNGKQGIKLKAKKIILKGVYSPMPKHYPRPIFYVKKNCGTSYCPPKNKIMHNLAARKNLDIIKFAIIPKPLNPCKKKIIITVSPSVKQITGHTDCRGHTFVNTCRHFSEEFGHCDQLEKYPLV